jgi:lipoate---protein ligase
VGYANKVAVEVNAAACAAGGVPIYRRCSGGGTVLQGPGCLNYSLVLRFAEHPTSNIQHPTSNEEQGAHLTPDTTHLRDPEATFNTSAHLRSIPAANRFIMERNRAAIEYLLSVGSRGATAPSSCPQPSTLNAQPLDQSLVTPAAPKALVSVCGHTDLTLGGLKFSGNAQRRRKRFLLFHGTFLLNFDLAFIEKILPMPSQQPAYRQNRTHAEFLTNLGLAAETVKRALRNVWQANERADFSPRARVGQLARDKYVTTVWNLKF